MKPTPLGWPRISISIYYQDPRKAIDWLCQAFGFEVRMKFDGPDGSIAHSELTYGEGVVMVTGEGEKKPGTVNRRSPRSINGANTQGLMLYVDDVDAHHERARAAGARIVEELKVADYGDEFWADRGYEAEDLEGHHWWFFQRVRNPPHGK